MAVSCRCCVNIFQLYICLLVLNAAVCKICPLGNSVDDEKISTELDSSQPRLSCPRPSDPEDYSECCPKDGAECCPPKRSFYEIDNTIATAIAVTVSLICLGATIAVILCCFWSKCPMYNTCRVQYSSQGEILYGKENENRNVMPSDTPSRKNYYTCPRPSLNSSKASLV